MILKFKPALLNHVWGGNKLKEIFQDHLDDINPVGEAWVLSAFENLKQASKCISLGRYYNLTLHEIYSNNPELFANSLPPYPHLIKFIDAYHDLSVQVHPDDEFAKKHHNSFGKNEAWYVLSDAFNQSIVYGHNATSKQELQTQINLKQWNKLLNSQSIKNDDFIYVPTGTIHALKQGNFVCEIQQASDITYRIYDYDRFGLDGKRRQLHTDLALQVISVPQNYYEQQKLANCHDQYLIDNQYFKVIKIDTKNATFFAIDQNKWYEIVVVSGTGKINQIDFKFGDAAIVTSNSNNLTLTGNLQFLIIVN